MGCVQSSPGVSAKKPRKQTYGKFKSIPLIIVYINNESSTLNCISKTLTGQRDAKCKMKIIKNYLIKNASITSIGRFAGAGSGVILDALILYSFGLGNNTDAFFAALTLPLILSGILELKSPKVIVPIYTQSYKQEGNEKTSESLCSLLLFSAAILFVISFLGTILSKTMITLQIPGLDPQVIELSAKLSRILIWIIFFRGFSAILQSILYIHHKFIVTSIIRFINNIMAIVIVLLLQKHIGIYAVAYGFVVGSTITPIYLAFVLKGIGFKFKIALKHNDPKLIKTFKLSIYPSIDEILSKSKNIIENLLASYLGAGSLSIIKYASRIVWALTGILMGSIASTALPLITHYTTDNDIKAMKTEVIRALKLLLVMCTPICIFLIFTTEPMIKILFERGKFTADNVKILSMVIGLLSPYVLLSRIGTLFQIPFYAKLDMRTPLIGTVIALFSFSIIVTLTMKKIGIFSFPIAYSGSSIFMSIVMYLVLKRNFGEFGFDQLKGFILKLAAISIFAAIGFYFGNRICSMIYFDNVVWSTYVKLVIPSLLGFGAYIAFAFLTGLIHYQSIVNIIKNR